MFFDDLELEEGSLEIDENLERTIDERFAASATSEKPLPLTFYLETEPIGKEDPDVTVTAYYVVRGSATVRFESVFMTSRGESSFRFSKDKLWAMRPAIASANPFARCRVMGNADRERGRLQKQLIWELERLFNLTEGDFNRKSLAVVEALRNQRYVITTDAEPMSTNRYQVLLRMICMYQAYISLEKCHVCFVQNGNINAGWRY